MKIALLSQYYPPEGGSCSIHMGEMAEFLAGRGHHVTVLTGFPNYPEGRVFEGYRRRLIRRETVDGVRIVRTFLFVTPHRRAFRPRLKNYLSFMITAMAGGVLSGRHDLIYFYSPPLFLGVTAAVLGRLWKAPVVMELNDLWPRAPIQLGVIRSPRAIRWAERLERFVYARCTKIFVYSRRMREELARAGVSGEKLEIHNLWIDTEAFRPADPSEATAVRSQYSLDGTFVVMYTGNLGLAQGLDTAIESARWLRDHSVDEIRIVLVGGGAERDRLIAMANEYGLDNVVFVPRQPAERMPAFMTAADVLLSHLARAPHRVGTIPAKILAYMACGRPVLVGAEGESADLVERAECGLAVEPENAEAMAKGILALARMPVSARLAMGEKARTEAVASYDRSTLLEALESRLSHLAETGPQRRGQGG